MKNTVAQLASLICLLVAIIAFVVAENASNSDRSDRQLGKLVPKLFKLLSSTDSTTATSNKTSNDGLRVRDLRMDRIQDFAGKDVATWLNFVKSLLNWMADRSESVPTSSPTSAQRMVKLTSMITSGRLHQVVHNKSRLLAMIFYGDFEILWAQV